MFSGEVKEHNPLLEYSGIDIINNKPEGDGWVLKAEVFDSWDITDLMDEAQYQKYCDTLPKKMGNDGTGIGGLTKEQIAGVAAGLAGIAALGSILGGDGGSSELPDSGDLLKGLDETPET